MEYSQTSVPEHPGTRTFRVPNGGNLEVSAPVVEHPLEPEQALALTGSARANQKPRLSFRTFQESNDLPERITFRGRGTTVPQNQYDLSDMVVGLLLCSPVHGPC